MDTRIGISGWRYAGWRGTFYPNDLAQKNELRYAAGKLNSIEINGSFYSLQRPSSWKRWREETPDDFMFSVKAPRYITHIRRLKNVTAPLGNFFASGVLRLEHKLGPFLWQLPPSLRFEDDILASFLEQLPRSVGEAAKLSRLADRLEPDLPPGARSSTRSLRHALEVRHHSFEHPEFINLLRRFDVALVFADTAGKWPYMEDLTSDFVYLRLHGEQEIYKSGYDDVSLKWWANRLRIWQSGRQARGALTMSDDPGELRPRDAFVYFDNDVKVRAPFDAERLRGFLQKSSSTYFRERPRIAPGPRLS